jgi:hypothetical protein
MTFSRWPGFVAQILQLKLVAERVFPSTRFVLQRDHLRWLCLRRVFYGRGFRRALYLYVVHVHGHVCFRFRMNTGSAGRAKSGPCRRGCVL